MVVKDRLINEFLELVKIDSLSSREGALADVLAEKLESLGFEVCRDDAGVKSGGETGNIIATLKGNRLGKNLLFSSHMDTVCPGEGVNPVVDEVKGIIRSDGTTVLGSDNKGGLAAILEAMKIIKENGIAHSDIQIVFSITEENGMLGAKHLDYSRINPDYAFVLDSSEEPGKIIVKAPAQDKIEVKIKGRTAHAGVVPEAGISAAMVAARAIERMKLLRVDEETTANIGTISGGTATNIVMAELNLVAEARSLSNSKLDAQTKHMVDTFNEAAAEFGAEIEAKTTRMYDSFIIDEEDKIVDLLKKGFSNMGIKAAVTSTGGGSDTNIYNANGIKAVNLGIGMKKAHTLEEYIAIEDLVKSARIVVEIVKEA